ncbi:type II CAAX endopeptidase family protein [Leifsonia sp. NPDC077715]|uniref:CPBP family intramembrane glutamic endopeptidase n=1 Tax=Leifsonia sp. NPDC077715 TaxID=3155539 RepID=UPI00343C6EF0
MTDAQTSARETTTNTAEGASTRAERLRIRPRVWIGLAATIASVVIVAGLQLVSGVSYDGAYRDVSAVLLGTGIPLIATAVFLAVVTSLLGWWRPAVFDRRRAAKWPLFVPALMLVGLLVNFVNTDWSAIHAGVYAASLLVVLVGFTEEIAFRGLMIVGLRGRFGELWVWLISTSVFALVHLVNVALGQEVDVTLTQVLFAFLAGTVFYILRRSTGSLIWAMVLHGLWDFSTVGPDLTVIGPSPITGTLICYVAGIIGVLVVGFTTRRADERL